ncbi:MAG: DUF2079 domain-containing protein [Thermoplasmatales archaeon]|nr:DUF2079 domain-containing protein [Thermoplasmatales archaeon]MCW6170317.1 DUF2079 domain-containing protein [Thermoplasmatales archaeon]
MFKNFLVKVYRSLTSDHCALSFAIALSAIFFVVYSYFSVLRYDSSNATAWDLGLHAQVLSSYLDGKFFYSFLLGKSLLAIHFQPFIFFLVPLYKVFPTPISLLILQSFFLSFSAVILFDLSFRIFKKRITDLRYSLLISFVLTLSYLISPLTFGSVMFDFHFLSFLPFFYFLAIDSFLTGKKITHLGSLALIVSLHSNFVYIVACILIFEFYLMRKGADYLEWKPMKTRNYQLMILLSSFVVLFIYLILSGLAKGIILVGFHKGLLMGLSHLSLLPPTSQVESAASTPIGLLIALFKSPAYVLGFVGANYLSKVYFFFIVIGTTGIISILYLPALIPIIPFLPLAIFSAYSPYYILGYQYSSMIQPIFYVSLPFSVIWLIGRIGKVKTAKFKNILKNYKPGIAAVIIASTLISIPFSPISPQGIYVGDSYGHLYSVYGYRSSPALNFLLEIRKDIPANAYILTQNNLMPYFSNYLHADSTPYSNTIEPNLGNFNYVIVQSSSSWASYSSVGYSLDSYANSYLQDGWKIMAEYSDYSILIIKKGSLSVPEAIIPLNESLTFHSSQSAGLVDNSLSKGYLFIPDLLPGNYTVSLRAPKGNSAYLFDSEVTISAKLSTTIKNSAIYTNFSTTSYGGVRFNLSTNYILQNIIITVDTINTPFNMYLGQARIIQVIA